MLSFFFAIAQEKSNKQAFWIHEDVVKPNMVEKYENATKNLISELSRHEISGINWLCSSTNNFKYWMVSPIDNMADLDRNLFKPLKEKMGTTSYSDMWDMYNECYDSHGSFILMLDKDLSYMPNGWDISTPGEDYREFDTYHIKPEFLAEANTTAGLIQDLYETKKSAVPYRVYKSGFGAMGPYFMVVAGAKNAADYAEKNAANGKLLGEEFAPLYEKFLSYCWKVDREHGSIRLDLSMDASKASNAAASN